MRNLLFLTLVALGAGCYSNAGSARRAQTLESEGWTCLGEPIVSCPNRPRGECTGWDERWLATCPDDQSRWVCRFVGTSRSVVCGRQ
jgi:hypothetical protein